LPKIIHYGLHPEGVMPPKENENENESETLDKRSTKKKGGDKPHTYV
jgi:hypothetical protein